MNRNKHKVWRIVGIVVLCLLLAGLGFGIWVSNNYKTILKQRIPVWVKRGTHGVYNVSVEDISINIFTRNVSLEGLKLWPDTSRIKSMNAADVPTTTFNISVPSVELNDIRWADIIADKDVVAGALVVNNPEIEILSRPADSLTKTKEEKKAKIDRLYAGDIIINNPNIKYKHTDNSSIISFNASGGKIHFQDWEFDPQRPETGKRFLYAKKASIQFEKVLYQTDGGLYNISSNNMDLKIEENTLNLTNLKIKTRGSRNDFYERVGHQQDQFDIVFPKISFTGFEWEKLINEKQLIVSAIELENPVMEDYFSRLPPPNPKSKMGNFPNQLLLKLELPVYVKEIRISNGDFKYTEVNEKSKRAGELVFSNITGAISNVTNIPQYINRNKECTIKLKGNFNGKSPITATFRLSLTDSAGRFSVDGELKDLDAPQVNEVAKALALTRIDSLQVNKLTLHVEGDQSYARGNITFLYNNLKLSLLDTNDKPKGVELDKKNFLSFVANSFLLYPDNPMKDKPVRSEGDYLKRDPYKSFFNLIWKTIFNSIQKTAIRSDNIQELIEENQKNKGKKKEGFFKRIFKKKDKTEQDKNKKGSK